MKFSRRFADLDSGVVVEISKEEAEQLGFWQEDAVSLEEAMLAGRIVGVDSEGNLVFEEEGG